MKTKILLSFDIEEFDLPEEFGVSVNDAEKFEISRQGTENILDLLQSLNVRATFFVTGVFAGRYPELIRRMVENDHEVASHGMDHSVFENAHLRQSREVLEKISGNQVTGFRMARLAEVSKEEIKSAGFEYESSLNPVWLPGRYCNLRYPLLPFREKCGLWQLPVSAVPFIRFPLFWLSFKNLPLLLYKMLASVSMMKTEYFNMYSHPWEYCELSREARWNIPRYITRHAGKKQTERLKYLIRYLVKKGEFVTFSEYLKGEASTQLNKITATPQTGAEKNSD